MITTIPLILLASWFLLILHAFGAAGTELSYIPWGVIFLCFAWIYFSVLPIFRPGKRKEEGLTTKGVTTWWYENGNKKQEGAYKNGKPEGLATRWHENGIKKQEGTYKDGQPEGLATKWHENGEKASEATFADGKLEGLVTNWDNQGKVVDQTRYKDGVEIKK